MDFSGADSSFAADMDGGGTATINMEKLRRIQASIPVQDPSAPLGSNKNPIRIIQQGNRFITTQNLSEEQLSQITQVLHNQSIMSEVQKPSGPAVSVGRSGLSPPSKALFRDLDNTGASPAGGKRRRGKRSPEEEDPDFDPIAEEEGRKPGRYLYPDDSIIFQCDRCDLQFMSRQALLKHVQLRHEQREARRTQYVPVRKRSALKAAVKTSTDEELVDICLPRLAKLANPFDFLLVKSERGDPPLPNLAMLVDDLVNLVDISRKFLKDHLVRLPPSEQRPIGSVCVDSQAKADILGVEVGNYGVRAVFNEGYLPPRHRASLQSRRGPGATAAAVTQAQQDFVGGQSTRFATLQPHLVEPEVPVSIGGVSGVQTDTNAGSFEISMKIGPKTAQTRQLQPQRQPPQQPVITDKDIAVERYYQVLDENGQPSDFVIEVATGQFFNRITGEQIAVMQETADAGDAAAASSSPSGTVTVTGVAGASPSKVLVAESRSEEAPATDSAVATDATAAATAASASENAEVKNGAAASEDAGSAAVAVAGADAGQQQPEAEAAASNAAEGGSQAGVAADTGEAVQIDLNAMFPGVTLQDLDDTVLLITKPDGSTLQVEHGGQGITLEFLQELLNTQFD